MAALTRLATLAACVLVLTGAAQADLLLEYTFNDGTNDTVDPTTEAAHVAGGGFVSGPGTGGGAASTNGLQSTGGNPGAQFSVGNVVGADEEAAVADGDYAAFTIAPETDYQLDYTALSFEVARSGSAAPTHYAVYYGIDGFDYGNALQGGALADQTVGVFNSIQVPLTDADVQQQTEFRLYFWGGTTANGAARVDNVAFTGTSELVPEPATLALFGLGALGVLRRRRHA